jgi:AraC-like DNA-binding protein
METLCTTGLARREKLAYWNEIFRSISQVKIDPIEPTSFWGCMRHVQLDAIRIVEVTSDPARVTRLQAHVAQSHESRFVAYMQLQGTSTLMQHDREAKLQPGDFTLCDNGPRVVIHAERITMLLLCIPDAVLRRRVACPEAAALHKMSGTTGPTAVAAACLRHVWSHIGELTPDLAPRFANIMLDLIGGALASLPETRTDRSCFFTKRRFQIVDYIEAHLRDCNLTPASVAARFGITPRHLYTVFGGKTEGIAKYILRRRLEESGRILVDPVQQARSVSEVAYDHGFNSLAHYSNVFRSHYGLTPREYRRRAAFSATQ